jgi:hypothetical protein
MPTFVPSTENVEIAVPLHPLFPWAIHRFVPIGAPAIRILIGNGLSGELAKLCGATEVLPIANLQYPVPWTSIQVSSPFSVNSTCLIDVSLDGCRAADSPESTSGAAVLALAIPVEKMQATRPTEMRRAALRVPMV